MLWDAPGTMKRSPNAAIVVLLVLAALAAGAAPPFAAAVESLESGARTAFPPLEIEPWASGDLAQVDPTRDDDDDDDEPKVPPVETEPDPGGPSRAKTILFSALLPGLGQLEAGDRGMGTVFLVGEAVCWTSLAVFRIQGNEREDRYIEYAERFAGVVDASGQSNDYYGNLAQYDRSGEPGGPGSYNEMEVRLPARELYPGDPARQEDYIIENSITGDQAWDWESDDLRYEYADIRVASETAYHRSEYAVAGLVVGRILSVLHAVWLTADREAPADEGGVKGAAAPFVESDFALGASRAGVRYIF